MNFISIIEGNLRSVLGIRTTIMRYREDVYCAICPLARNEENQYTGQCNKAQGGCGCGISAKTSQNSSGCPKGFWGSDWFKPELFRKFLEDGE